MLMTAPEPTTLPPKHDASHVMKHATAAFGSSLASGMMTSKDVSDVIELNTNLAICNEPAKFDPTVGPAKAKQILSVLVDMVTKLPLQNRRDEEMEKFQQFSTPPHIAYLMAWVANLDKNDVVLEPSAGTGGLCCFAINAGAAVFANEISERRVQLLRAMPVKRVFAENAEQIHNILDPKISPSVVLMNPPFSVAGTRMQQGTKVRQAGCLHIDQALLRLRQGGRLVALIGDRQGRGDRRGDDGSGRGMADLAWWNALCATHTVRASIGIPGKEYHRYGTDIGTRLVIVDKCGPTPSRPVLAEASSVEQVIDVTNGAS